MAEWTAAYIDDLPDSSFAYIESGGTKDEEGKTTPRSLRHFPIRDADGKPDAAHVRNALSRLPQSPFGSKARAKVEAAARSLGVGEPAAKAFYEELKAEPFDTRHYDSWLSGRIPRRILMLPFGGPIPKTGAPKGVDIDQEFFSERTDIYDDRPALKASRYRIVDWHHNEVPPPHKAPPQAAAMKGALVGHLVFDDLPEDDGIWADWWARAGENRMRLIAALEKHSIPLFGSSKAMYKVTDDSGEILTWPLVAHTVTTSPQNTYAVVPALKAVLASSELDDIPADAIKAFLTGMNADERELLLSLATSPGVEAVKAESVLSDESRTALLSALEQVRDLYLR